MMREITIKMLCLFFVFGLATQALAYTSVYPTGTVLYKPDKAFGGFTILCGENDQMLLVDMNGNLAHSWQGVDYMFRPMPGGKMLATIGSWSEGQQDAYQVLEVDFDGKVVWSFRNWQQVTAIPGQPQENGKTWISRAHHDMQRKGMPLYYTPGVKPEDKGVTLILGHINEKFPKVHKDAQLITDAFYEVDNKTGQVIWKWIPSEHFDELGFGEDAIKSMQAYPPVDNPAARRHGTAVKEGSGFDWLHVNTLGYVGPNKWYDAGDKRFHPDNVIFNCRDANLFAIVDRESGKIVWKVGPDFGPGSPSEKLGQMIGSHAVHMIPKGLPGEGNILVFDNGGLAGYGKPSPMSPVTGFHNARRDYSRIVELDPVKMEVVWQYDYTAANPKVRPVPHFIHKFFSPFVSCAQRLPNGNTMITEGDAGRVFEVTPQLETVWEYNNPFTAKHNPPLVYRAYRLPYEWVPQVQKPEEVAVSVDNGLLVVPDAKGRVPNTGYGKALNSVKVISDAVPAAPKGGKDAQEGEEPGMHKY